MTTGFIKKHFYSKTAVPTPEGIIEEYFNQDAVKEALHVDKSIHWEVCNMNIN